MLSLPRAKGPLDGGAYRGRRYRPQVVLAGGEGATSRLGPVAEQLRRGQKGHLAVICPAPIRVGRAAIFHANSPPIALQARGRRPRGSYSARELDG